MRATSGATDKAAGDLILATGISTGTGRSRVRIERDTARDRVSGFKGICICRTEWISGCTRVGLQAPVGKDGKVPDTQHFDEPMLEVVKWVDRPAALASSKARETEFA